MEDIWGIGSKLKKELYRIGIYSAFNLANADELLLKKHLSVNVLKTALELKEINCIKNEGHFSSKKSICTSRSFIDKIDDLKTLEEFISAYTSIAAKKLRNQKMHTNFIIVFITTSFHSKDPFYSNSCQIKSPIPTSYTPDLISLAKTGLKRIFKEGYSYKKAGVILSDLTKENICQQDLFSDLNNKNKEMLMKIIDDINFKANKKAVFFASEGIERKYKGSSYMKSLKFTTSFDELIKVKNHFS